MEDTTFFKRKRVVWEQLPLYGFIKTDGSYHFSEDILGGQFRLFVSVSEDGAVDTKIIDATSGEEYVLHRVPGAVGSFAGSVREAYEWVMFDIAAKCFETDIFKSKQAREIIVYVRETYGDELEYLWQKFPDNAIWRRKDNQKWYAALLTVSKRKLGFKSDEPAEIIDLRADPDELDSLLDDERYLPGYHMNKKNWYTIVLDDSVPIGEIKRGIDVSFLRAANKSR